MTVPLTRATEEWADAELEHEFARLNPEIQRRVGIRLLELDALRREVERLEEQLAVVQRERDLALDLLEPDQRDLVREWVSSG